MYETLTLSDSHHILIGVLIGLFMVKMLVKTDRLTNRKQHMPKRAERGGTDDNDSRAQ